MSQFKLKLSHLSFPELSFPRARRHSVLWRVRTSCSQPFGGGELLPTCSTRTCLVGWEGPFWWIVLEVQELA